VDNTAVDQAPHEVCPRNVPGSLPGRRRILKVSVDHIFKYCQLLRMTIYWTVSRSFGHSCLLRVTVLSCWKWPWKELLMVSATGPGCWTGELRAGTTFARQRNPWVYLSKRWQVAGTWRKEPSVGAWTNCSEAFRFQLSTYSSLPLHIKNKLRTNVCSWRWYNNQDDVNR